MENVTLKDLDKALSLLVVPVQAFKVLLTAAKSNNTRSLDPTQLSNYTNCLDKVEKHFDNVIYVHQYSSNDYNNMYNCWVKLFAVLDTLVQGVLEISDITKQQIDVVIDLLLSYGFDIYQVFDDRSLRIFAMNIYGYLRRKGTATLLSMMLQQLGYSSFVINEYALNKKNGEWVFVPEKILEVPNRGIKSKFKSKAVPLKEVPDPLWWLSSDDLNELYIKHYNGLISQEY